MAANPFTSMFRYRTARDPFQIMQCIGHKCIEDSDSAAFGMEYPRQILIDYYGPNYRNAEFDLDTTKFYYYQHKEASGVNHNIWLGVTLTEDVILNLSGVISDPNTSLYVISKCSVDISENTIKACRLLSRFYTMMMMNSLNMANRMYPYSSGDAVIHILANYMYRAFDINLSTEENFKTAIMQNGATPSYIRNSYEFFKKDFVYCNTIARDDLDYTKVIGSSYRFNKEYGFKSDVVHAVSGEIFSKDDEVDPEHKVFNTDFPLTFADVTALNTNIINGAGWSLTCMDYDSEDLDNIRVVLDNIFFYPRTNNFVVEDIFSANLIATTGLAICCRPIGGDHNELLTEKNVKKLIDYLKCLNSVNDGVIDSVELFFVKLRAMLILDDISAVYYCTAVDNLIRAIKAQTCDDGTLILRPCDIVTISNLHNFNQLIDKTMDGADKEHFDRIFDETDEVELAEFLFNCYTPISSDKTPWEIAVEYCEHAIEKHYKHNGDEDDNSDEEDAEDDL